MPITFQGAPYPAIDEAYYYTSTPPSSSVGYLPFGIGRLDSAPTAYWGTNNTPSILFPFLLNKPFQKISISHTAGTHPTAFLELAAYNMGIDGRPTTLIEKGTVSLSATGIKTVNFTTPRTINRMFFVGIRPNIGVTEWSSSGGSGSLTLRGIGTIINGNWSQIFGCLDPSNFSNNHGCLLYRYISYNLFPNDLTNDVGIALEQTANITQGAWIPVVHT